MPTHLEDLGPGEWDVICLSNWLATTSDQVYFKDRGSRLVRVSARVVDAMRTPRAELQALVIETEADLIGKTDLDLFVEETSRPAFEAEQDIFRSGVPVPDVVERQTWGDGSVSYVTTSKMPLLDRDGEVVGTFGFSRDVTDDIAVRRQLASVLEYSPDAISRFDLQLRYRFVNHAAAFALRSTPTDIIGLTDAELGRDSEFLQLWVPALRKVLDTLEPTRIEYSTGEGDAVNYYESRLVPETDGDIVTGLLVFTRDITDRKRAELALADQASRDPLTGLANRVLLLDRLELSLLRLDRVPGTVAVLVLDLDKFKPVNDTLGHAAGDVLLKQVADRLRGCARRSDTLARFGGDEFVVLCDRLASPGDARAIAERMMGALGRPFAIGDHVVHVAASVGVAADSDPNVSPSELLRDADTAMYEAKEHRRGSGRYKFFDPARRDRAVDQLKTENELRVALAEGQLRLHYQAMHVLSSGDLHGFEALVRWQHPARGLLMPADFIPVAEDSDIIVNLGEWVIDEACGQLARWNAVRTGMPPLVMSVNVSGRQLRSRRLVDAVGPA